MPIKRYIAIAIVAAIVAGLVVYGFWPKPVPVDVVEASIGPLSESVREEAKTRVVDRYTVSAPVAGYIGRVDLRPGDIVKKGDSIATIGALVPSTLDPREKETLEATVKSASSVVEAASEALKASEADLALFEDALTRTKKLFDEGAISKSRLEAVEADAIRARANVLRAKAQVKGARFDLERAKAALKYQGNSGARKGKDRAFALKSPVNGKVLKLHKESEGVVMAGEPILHIGDPARLEVVAEVLSTEAVKLRPGLPVLFERWGGGDPLEGRVKYVEPGAFTKLSSLGVEEQRVLVVSELTSSPEKYSALGDGFRLEARFVVWSADKVLVAPMSAIFKVGDEFALFVIEGNRAVEKKVKLGHGNGLKAEVLSGLSAGDLVVADPEAGLRDGAPVKRRSNP